MQTVVFLHMISQKMCIMKYVTLIKQKQRGAKL